ncbi:hypothetical protein GE061_006543 [Apolygus lucorum]|uniref:Uncharacterized protein n=1 Tax=Apolygus lucorum TaxID=248454 RepID=A0A6A4IY74_APOLU|nr:hypothetical protein GE061_006543 [Apolygus lucorum]
MCNNSCTDQNNSENLPSMRSLESSNEKKLDEGYMDHYIDNGQYTGLQLDIYDDPDPYDKKNFENAFDNFTGDLLGWRKVDIREFPYVVSLMHQKYKVHICTGTLLSSKVVLSYIRCVVRRKTVADKVVFTVAEAYQIIVAAGLTSLKIKDADTMVFRHVDLIITTYDNAFKGHLVFLMLEKALPYSIYHHPVKLYSMDLKVVGKKLQEHVGKSFCEVITWEDTVICSDSKILRPKNLKAYRVKILESSECSTQKLRLGVRSSGDWSIKSEESQHHCFVGMGGRRCGSAPGGPVVCGNSVYGIMSLGTSCSEFGDFTDFIPLNTSEIYLLYKQTIEVERDAMNIRSLGCLNTATWALIISMIYASLPAESFKHLINSRV